MDVRSYSNVRQNLASVMDEVCDSHAPVIVTRQNAASVVIMSLDEFNATEETLHLLRSPRNAERLLRSTADADAGRLVEHPLADA
ncbi:hypothetical protein CU669_04065 [Paramagnetospirillum kuznetsovii]|uniref:Antitoxin n=1 Tax=Paramagnetospirillum kuznetsovii TaxID=2053833 RepID=A0A364P2C7_9PROT|nr:type II toxin-antitoxin system prevent-host-death family antitoxin [Paramagnetospirillum kuznetsovii]RAU23508.1 hypothetical protein CU669_04065 [Paramagnetospirillum kuznetsovii]